MKKVSMLLLGILLACGSDDRVDDPIPFFPFSDIFINISLPSYNALQVDGGHIVITEFGGKSVGTKGIIIYRESITTYRAFEQNCSFQPNDACANVEAFSIYMQDACCGSVFNYDGDPTGGPAWRPLAQYETKVSGSNITITDEVINY